MCAVIECAFADAAAAGRRLPCSAAARESTKTRARATQRRRHLALSRPARADGSDVRARIDVVVRDDRASRDAVASTTMSAPRAASDAVATAAIRQAGGGGHLEANASRLQRVRAPDADVGRASRTWRIASRWLRACTPIR